MKEQVQVSFDLDRQAIICEKHGVSRVVCKCFLEDYERLKRLDENVKWMISELKNKADKIKNADCGFKNAEGEHVPSKEWVEIKHFIMRLRSLYNEKQG